MTAAYNYIFINKGGCHNDKRQKITILGTGNVGATIAYTLAIDGMASEILLIDINEKKAQGEAMDILQGTPFCAPVNIHAGRYEEAVNSDVVIVTVGLARKPGQSRIDLAQVNVDIKIGYAADNKICSRRRVCGGEQSRGYYYIRYCKNLRSA